MEIRREWDIRTIWYNTCQSIITAERNAETTDSQETIDAVLKRCYTGLHKLKQPDLKSRTEKSDVEGRIRY
jgi:hypothetical protein